MTNTYSFAESELDILSASSTDPENRPIIEPFRDEILALCEKVGNSGQSGGSIGYVAQAIGKSITKLLLQEPLLPIQGTEFIQVADDVFQNTRCGTIFKTETEPAYYLDAITWRTQTGSTWSGNALLNGKKYTSRQYIKSFPFTPKTFIIDVIEEEVTKDDWEFYIKDAKQLEEVFDYYTEYGNWVEGEARETSINN